MLTYMPADTPAWRVRSDGMGAITTVNPRYRWEESAGLRMNRGERVNLCLKSDIVSDFKSHRLRVHCQNPAEVGYSAAANLAGKPGVGVNKTALIAGSMSIS